MRQLILSILFILILIPSYSQFNDSVHHYIKYGIAGMINHTNDGRSFVLTNALTYDINKRKIAVNSNASWIYGTQNNDLLNNDFSSVVNVDMLKDIRRLYYWCIAAYTSSYSLNVHYQFQTGAGIGYNILKKQHALLIISDGIVYETADVQTALKNKDVYQLFRNSLRLKYSWRINDLVSLDGTHFWQPSLSALNDYVIRSISSLSVKLKKWLSINASLVYNKFSRTNRENLLINFGVITEQYF